MSIRWEEVTIGEICEKSFYGTSDATTDTGKYPVIKMNHMQNGGLILKDMSYIDYDEKTFNKYKLYKGDILLNRTNSYELVGKVSLFDLDGDYLTASYLVALRLNREKANPKFINEVLNTKKMQDKIRVYVTKGVSQANINPAIFKQHIKVPLPPLKEQEKIAEILSSCDEHIKNLKNLKSELEKEKLHLMNELLSGKTRFANFTTPWQEVAIKDIFQEYTKLNSDNYDQYTIGKNGIKPFEDKRHSITNHKTFKKNDLIIGIGIDEVNININIENGCCSPIYHIYNLNEEKLNPIFGYFAIKTLIQPIKGKIIKTSTRRQFEFTHSEFLKYFLILPSLEEQKKIGEVLSACDERLECLNELITAQTTLKSHLLTELLNGNLRVKDY
ncbi:restriction endonuclease subunit S [Campylobacter sp. RM12647]|uniref:restriction endonuclease subunit S n=1 Tax=Campylobacter sp. RM12647 TaxID=2735737 RepID=UPI001D9BA39C|nr:restriction endonuclease subunit S [Campylobacter sp. RM12647]